ncbi:hypothetical protein IWX47DRAFT_651510 [Phyllosticta citricarpa]
MTTSGVSTRKERSFFFVFFFFFFQTRPGSCRSLPVTPRELPLSLTPLNDCGQSRFPKRRPPKTQPSGQAGRQSKPS